MAAVINLYPSSPEGVSVVRTSSGYTINFTLPQYYLNDIKTPQGSMTTVSIPGYGVTSVPGKPMLPQITFNLVISENGGAPAVSVISRSTFSTSAGNHVFPFQAPYRRDLPPEKRPFNYDADYYSSAGELRPQLAAASEPFNIGGLTGVRVTISPFSYNPLTKELTVTRTAEFRIDAPAVPERISNISDVYAGFYQNFFAAFEAGNLRTIKNYLIITAPEYQAGLAQFVSHKSSLGFNVDLFTTQVTGTTTTAIKSFIQQRYNDPGTKPEFILLVGDIDKIPCWTGAGEGTPNTDMNYVLLQGTDYYADAFIGRFSITNATELQNIISKIIYTENNLATQPKSNVFMASTDNYSITEGTHNYVISTYFEPGNYSNLKLYSHNGATTQQVSDALNANKIFAIYSGHGSETSWADGPVFTQSNIRNLTNTFYPFVYSFACITGSYHIAECFGETWIRDDKGASAFYGSSVNSYWDEDDILERKLIKAMFEDNLTKVTPMFDMAKYLTCQYYGGNVTPGSTMLRYLEMYNLMGDPSIETMRAIPPDTTPPDPVTNLTAGNATSNSVTLNWTAPYDSTFGGVQSYDIRYSTQPILNDNDFNNASQKIFAGQSDTLGTPKSFCVAGLTSATSYHFAIKALDMWGNKSQISNPADGTTLAFPMVSVSPGSISHLLANQSEVTDTIFISNAAPNPSTLDYEVEFDNNIFPTGSVSYSVMPVAPVQPYSFDKNEVNTAQGQMTEGSGGPDLFGYKWIDSDEPAGPQYVWDDIVTTGTPVTSWIPTGSLSSTDEGYAGPLNLGFNFKYYGSVKSQIYISTNGFLCFSPVTSNAYSNTALPDNATPNEIISPFWDDLDAKAPGTVHYKQDGNRFIIQFTNYQRYSGTASYTWQVVIYSSGKILFYYKNMTGTLNSATTGIENADGTIGLQMAYNANYVKNNLAVKLAADPEWLTTNSLLHGTLGQGNTAAVIVRIVTEDFPLGNYSMDMMVHSNCGLHPLVTVPISLTLSPIPVELTSFEAETIRDEVHLTWETATEVNNLGFTIERKEKGKSAWSGAGFIEGRGTTSEKTSYLYNDKNLKPGSYEYRLKQTNHDGTFSYSKILGIEVGLPEEFALYQNYPNPFNPSTIITYAVPRQENSAAVQVTLRIYDVTGNEVITLTDQPHEPGIYKAEFNASHLANGIYLCRMTAGKYTSVIKLLLIK